jgi:hypothetical protein
MINRIHVLLALVACFSTGAFSQNDAAFIYGTVSTIDGEKYSGQLRWGNEETFWEDEFNSTKTENPYNRYSSKAQEDLFKDNSNGEEWNFMGLWKDKNCCNYYFQNHQFACRFGDIKVIEPSSQSEISIVFKDDSKMRVSGGSNDIGAKISVMDPELGEINIPWSRINRVEFSQGPEKLKKKFGEPLYGKVKTIRGEFLGFIQWDHEECLSVDKLDGNNTNGRLSIEMGDIRKIERYGRGSKVTLKSDRVVELFGTNDVDASNKGVVVRTKDFGKVLIEWSDFEYVEFIDDYPKDADLSYTEFPKPKRIKGEVVTLNNEKIQGLIVFDVDEAWDYELLEGNDYQVKYSIPFRNIASVKPKNYNFSTITMKNGKSVLLGDSQDVSDSNDGMMLFKSEKDEEPVLIPWKTIKEINLQ